MSELQMQEREAHSGRNRHPSLAWEDTVNAWLRTHTGLVAFLVVAAGFLLRVRAAAGTFLNPDEALHFSIANQASFAAAYRGSLTLAHPPLMVLLLYFWRAVGTSEFILRLPLVIAGTVFCWLFFKWLKHTLGGITAVIGVIFMALLPPIVLLSAELRQYSLLLVSAAAAVLLLELAFAKNSFLQMALSCVCLVLAMLSHYSGLLFAAAFGIYSVLRLIRSHFSRAVIATWIAGQLAALVLFVFLYRTQISRLKNSALAEQAISEWLRRSYFHPGNDNLLVFVVGRSFAVFQFIFGQHAVGDIAGLLFLAGVVFLLKGKLREQASARWQFGVFLLLPFAINCALAILGHYPYGGTRHSVFLAMFAIPGISALLVKGTRYRLVRAMTLAALIVAICYAFGFHHQPYMTRDDQSRGRMDQAMEFVRSQIPPAEPVFVDYQGNLMLSHYLCQQPPSIEVMDSRFQRFHCGGHNIVSAPPRMWMFAPETFPKYWDDAVSKTGLEVGNAVWVVQAGWGASIAPGLQHIRSDISPLDVQSFGRNITVFKLTVGSPASAQPKKISMSQ